MYTSYARKSALFVISYVCFVKCENVRHNCSSYHHLHKENLRNCLVDINDRNATNDTTNLVLTDAEIEEKTDKYYESLGLSMNSFRWELQLTEEKSLFFIKNDNETMTVALRNTTSSVDTRGKKLKVADIIPYLIIPGFIMAGIVPWIIPGLKMVVMMVAMINQMAFMGALFALIRGFIFGGSKEEHIVYLNHGYNKYKYQKNPHEHR